MPVTAQRSVWSVFSHTLLIHFLTSAYLRKSWHRLQSHPEPFVLTLKAVLLPTCRVFEFWLKKTVFTPIDNQSLLIIHSQLHYIVSRSAVTKLLEDCASSLLITLETWASLVISIVVTAQSLIHPPCGFREECLCVEQHGFGFWKHAAWCHCSSLWKFCVYQVSCDLITSPLVPCTPGV